MQCPRVIFGDFFILWLQVEDGVSFLVPVLDEIRLDAGLQERAGPERGRGRRARAPVAGRRVYARIFFAGGVGSGVRLGLIFLQGEQGFGPWWTWREWPTGFRPPSSRPRPASPGRTGESSCYFLARP